MIWFLQVVLITAAMINIVLAIKYRRACQTFRRMVGYHQAMISALRSCVDAAEQRDREGVDLFFYRYQVTVQDYDLWLETRK